MCEIGVSADDIEVQNARPTTNISDNLFFGSIFKMFNISFNIGKNIKKSTVGDVTEPISSTEIKNIIDKLKIDFFANFVFIRNTAHLFTKFVSVNEYVRIKVVAKNINVGLKKDVFNIVDKLIEGKRAIIVNNKILGQNMSTKSHKIKILTNVKSTITPCLLALLTAGIKKLNIIKKIEMTLITTLLFFTLHLLVLIFKK